LLTGKQTGKQTATKT